MEIKLHLSSEEINEIEIELKPYKKGAKTNKNLEYFLTKWRDFVIEVEEGYRLTIYDYTNDLSLRDILQRIIDKVQQNAQKEILNCLVEWDNRFINVTEEVRKPLLPSIDDKKKGWWWNRIPLNLGKHNEEWFTIEK